ncbi:MAG: hypothetical protein ACREF9_05250 [Opitutaceae bacterium]
MRLKDEIELLDQHSRTTQLVIANLVAARERLMALPHEPKRERLIALQQQAIDAAEESLEFTDNTLVHLRNVEGLYVGVGSQGEIVQR